MMNKIENCLYIYSDMMSLKVLENVNDARCYILLFSPTGYVSKLL